MKATKSFKDAARALLLLGALAFSPIHSSNAGEIDYLDEVATEDHFALPILTHVEIKSVVTDQSRWQARLNAYGGVRRGAKVGNHAGTYNGSLSNPVPPNEQWQLHFMSDGRFTIRPQSDPSLCLDGWWSYDSAMVRHATYMRLENCSATVDNQLFFIQKSKRYTLTGYGSEQRGRPNDQSYVIRSVNHPRYCLDILKTHLWYDRAAMILYDCQSLNRSEMNNRFFLDATTLSYPRQYQYQDVLSSAADTFALHNYKAKTADGQGKSLYLHSWKYVDMNGPKGPEFTDHGAYNVPLKDPTSNVRTDHIANQLSTVFDYTATRWDVDYTTTTTERNWGHKLTVTAKAAVPLLMEASLAYEFSYLYKESIANQTGFAAISSYVARIPPGEKFWIAMNSRTMKTRLAGKVITDLGDEWTTGTTVLTQRGYAPGFIAYCGSGGLVGSVGDIYAKACEMTKPNSGRGSDFVSSIK